MPAYKDAQKGTWYAAFYYQDWKGVKKKKLKRGFPTKKEALAWERTFLLQQAADLTMTFEAFVEIYIVDKQKDAYGKITAVVRATPDQMGQIVADLGGNIADVPGHVLDMEVRNSFGKINLTDYEVVR